MRVLVISDVHANLIALEAVLANAAGEWDALWCLGDLVGYGPWPNECVSLVQAQKPAVCLSGNHDWAVLGKLDVNTFNADARQAVVWTAQALHAEVRAFLELLPPKVSLELFTLAHGSPRQPVWEYVDDYLIALENLAHFSTPYCLVGHTHIPAIFEADAEHGVIGYHADYSRALYLSDKRLILNPGSVGQPRDADPRAAFALLDLETLTWQPRRVEYAVNKTQAQMRALGFSSRQVTRLAYGW